MGIRCTSPSNRNYQLNFHRHPVPAAPPPAPPAPPPAPPPCAQAPVDMPNASAAPSTRIPIFFFTISSFCLKKCAPKRKRPAAQHLPVSLKKGGRLLTRLHGYYDMAVRSACPLSFPRFAGVHSRYGLRTRAVTVFRETLSEGTNSAQRRIRNRSMVKSCHDVCSWIRTCEATSA